MTVLVEHHTKNGLFQKIVDAPWCSLTSKRRAGAVGRADRAVLRQADGHRVGASREAVCHRASPPITALPEPEPPAPTKWKLPKVVCCHAQQYVELMIEPLTPLFDTLVDRASMPAWGSS